MQFRYSCDDLTPQNVRYDELIHLLETASEIPDDVFTDRVAPDPVLERFEDQYSPIEDDPDIRCYAGELPDGTPACYFVYSGIEHVFY